MELADLVAAVVVLGVGEIGIAALGLAARRVSRRSRRGGAGFQPPRAPVKPAHEVVLRREVRPPAQIQPDSRREVNSRHSVLALRHQHERAAGSSSSSTSTSSDAGDGIEGENRRRSVGGRAGIGAWDVVEGGVNVELILLLVVVLGLILGVVVRTVEVVVVSEGRRRIGVVVGVVLMMMMMMVVVMIMIMMMGSSEEVPGVVVEGGLGGGVVFEKVLPGRVGSLMLLRLLPRQHDRRRVSPFVVQHFFLRRRFTKIKPTEKFKHV